MAFRKHKPSGNAASVSMAPLNFPSEALEKVNSVNPVMSTDLPAEADVDIDMREVYFLIMHFLSVGPFKRTYEELCNELLEHQLLPRRYHAWYSRSGVQTGDENDDGISLPLGYPKLVERYPHIDKDHLVKLLKQLILSSSPQLHSMIGGGPPNAADVPTLVGSNSFSLLASDRCRQDKETPRLPIYLRWPHMQADQVRGLSLREIGGFTKHHRAPSVRAACYAIAKPSTLVEKMQIIKKLRGHQNAVYCATFDRSGRYVITGSDDRLVKIWAMETAFCLASCRGHEGDITDLAVSSNNALVASSSNDFIIRVWRIPDGLPISVLKGHTGVVTAIAFSPRPGAAYQLLSSSDDGTCRIWDARHSQQCPRVYIPKPPDVVPGKSGDPSSTTVLQNRQILCCAFNANGTVFVTGSSDTFARVWNACKSPTEEPDQPNHEMDLLSGHENDVNYVQFSGCAVASRSFSSDITKEDNNLKLKNSWFTHNIVTCSHDGSAIIWVPRSRRSHGKVGRWTRAYHLKVPPPPMPPQPPRGGPRQRYQPTPRGVNMIVWSLDNRFVLAAIMDCRICVWNASDGSLVHSLIGHKESTFVLDVHPFNPRIAMSAGYDGKTIIWDIWEGKPVQIYETGHFKLVDGKFSPDGTSIILSDEVGQIFIIATGQGESQKDAKYDQFFLGDYRPLIQDTNGNVMDQETQLPPYRRNIQDLLCDSSMIPYPEPYQSMYQKHRLGTLGIEWRPPSVNFAVGPTYNASTGEYQILPIIDPDRWLEPLPEITDFIELEPENDVHTDDTDSEYNGTDEYSSEGEQEILSGGSSHDSDSSAEVDVDNLTDTARLRRSKRKKNKSDAELVTSSGRRVKKRNLDEHDGATVSRAHRVRKSRNGRLIKRKKSPKSRALRPQRRAARNALSLFSKITGASTDGEDEDESESSSSESESMLNELNTPSTGPERSMQNGQLKLGRDNEFFQDDSEDVTKPSQFTETQGNPGTKRKLVLKLPCRDSKIRISSESGKAEFSNQDKATASLAIANHDAVNPELTGEPGCSSVCKTEVTRERVQNEKSDQPDVSAVHNSNTIKWGEVKLRSSKRYKFGDSSAGDMWPTSSNIGPDSPIMVGGNAHGHPNNLHATSFDLRNQTCGSDLGRNGQTNYLVSQELDGSTGKKMHHEYGDSNQQMGSYVQQNGQKDVQPVIRMDDGIQKNREINEHSGNHAVKEMTTSDNHGHSGSKNDSERSQQVGSSSQPIYWKLKIKSRGLANEANSSSDKSRSAAVGDYTNSKQNKVFVQHHEDSGINQQTSHHGDFNYGSGSLQEYTDKNILLHGSKKLHMDSDKMYSAVYTRSKSSKHKESSDADMYGNEESTSVSNNDSGYLPPDYSPARAGSSRRSVKSTNAPTDGGTTRESISRTKHAYGSLEASTSGRRSFTDGHDQLICDRWRSTSKTAVGLRSARNRRENCNFPDTHLLDKRRLQVSRKLSWLMLLEHEESYRYIPQHGDEVMYLRQGHEEYVKGSPRSSEPCPWKWIKDLKAVELCKVRGLEYSTFTGSGESCCKLTIEFTDPTSSGFGKVFKITLPELDSAPDFLVERTRFEAAIERNWTHRDKCQVWWRNEDGEGGSWWEGRILAVRPKSSEFPESPWEKFVIQYKNDGSEHHLHSPWELHDAGSPWEHPHIDVRSRDKLLSAMAKLEQTSVRNQDCYGILKLNLVAQKPDFINRFPVQFSIDVIKRRLENNYYRTLEAVRHDATVMLSNAESYFAKSTEMTSKIHRLSDWITRTFSSL